jgi:hypothetical protein
MTKKSKIISKNAHDDKYIEIKHRNGFPESFCYHKTQAFAEIHSVN